MSSMKLKIKKFVLHSVKYFEADFHASYKGLQITQNLTCRPIKHVDILLASSVLNVNYKIRKIHRNIRKDNLPHNNKWSVPCVTDSVSYILHPCNTRHGIVGVF